MQPVYIAVEGPIRAGKTTLARLLAEAMAGKYVSEPEENPFLSGFYAGQPAAFAAQMWFLERRHQQLRALEGVEGPVVADYIFEKDKIFACLNLTDAELDLYERFYGPMREGLRVPDLVIYLKATAGVLRQRMRRKNVPSERAISEEYIGEVAASYDHFFEHYTGGSLLVVETSGIDFVNRAQDLAALIQRVRQPVRGVEYYLPLPAAVA